MKKPWFEVPKIMGSLLGALCETRNFLIQSGSYITQLRRHVMLSDTFSLQTAVAEGNSHAAILALWLKIMEQMKVTDYLAPLASPPCNMHFAGMRPQPRGSPNSSSKLEALEARCLTLYSCAGTVFLRRPRTTAPSLLTQPTLLLTTPTISRLQGGVITCSLAHNLQQQLSQTTAKIKQDTGN